MNHGDSFASLRQIFHSMILAKWYEQHFKNSILGQAYVDRNVVEGIRLDDTAGARRAVPETRAVPDIENHAPRTTHHAQSIDEIYNQYLSAFQSGAADIIKEEYDPVTQTVIPRKYFTGGVNFSENNNSGQKTIDKAQMAERIQGNLNEQELLLLQIRIEEAQQTVDGEHGHTGAELKVVVGSDKGLHIEKRSTNDRNKSQITQEGFYYQGLRGLSKGEFPELIAFDKEKGVLRLEYFAGHQLRRLFAYGEIGVSEAEGYLERIYLQYLRAFLPQNFMPAPSSYIRKDVIDRILGKAQKAMSEVPDKFSDFYTANTVFVNGKELVNPFIILKAIGNNRELMEILRVVFLSLFHGDMHFGNILVNERQHKLIDSRGKLRGDYIYDFAKILQSLKIKVDLMHNQLGEAYYRRTNDGKLEVAYRFNADDVILQNYDDVAKISMMHLESLMSEYDIEQIDPFWRERLFFTYAALPLSGFFHYLRDYTKDEHAWIMRFAKSAEAMNSFANFINKRFDMDLPAGDNAVDMQLDLNWNWPEVSFEKRLSHSKRLTQNNDLLFHEFELLKGRLLEKEESSHYLAQDAVIHPLLKIGRGNTDKLLSQDDDALDWLIKRVEIRHGRKVDGNLRQKIKDVFMQHSLTELLGRPSGIFQEGSEEDSLVFNAVLGEAAFFFNSLPKGAEHHAVNVFWNAGAYRKMAQARKIFRDEIDIVLSDSDHYWKKILPKFRGEVLTFNDSLQRERYDVSYKIVSMVGRRFESLLKRLDEVRGMDFGGSLEVVVVVADPLNFNSEMMSAIKNKSSQIAFPITLVFSKRNTIAINRNLASSVSRGDYQIFVDDDVRIVGPAVKTLVEALKKYPDAGALSLPAVDKNLSFLKPRYRSLKFGVNDELLVTNTVKGMILASPRHIVRAVPYVHFLPGAGDDNFFVRQVHLFGFLGGYIVSDYAYVMDEEVDFRATDNPRIFMHILVQEFLQYYFSPEFYDVFQENLSVYKFLVRGRTGGTLEQLEEFWMLFREILMEYLEGKTESLSAALNSEDRIRWIYGTDPLKQTVSFFERHKNEITSFKEDYKKKNLSDVDPFLGPLGYRSQQNAAMMAQKSALFNVLLERQKVGGIDLNNLNMRTTGDSPLIKTGTVPGNNAMMMPLRVLTPRIINVGTVKTGVFLGLNTQETGSDPSDPVPHEIAAIREDS